MPETLSSTRSTVQGRWTVDARWTVDQPNRGCPYSRARVSGPRTWPDRNAQLCAGLDPAPSLTERSPTPGRFHFRERVSLAKYNGTSQAIVDYGLKVAEYFANLLRTWQSGKVLRN